MVGSGFLHNIHNVAWFRVLDVSLLRGAVDGRYCPLCSRIARPEKGLVRCAQWRTTGGRRSGERISKVGVTIQIPVGDRISHHMVGVVY